MSFDTIAFGTVNSIHYRSSLHSRRDVLYVAFFVNVHWIYNGHAKSTWNKWANGRTHWRAWPTSLSCNCFEFRHTLTFRQTAHCRTQEEAVCHFFKQKNQAQQCVSNNSIRCAVQAMACGSWSKKQFMRLQQTFLHWFCFCHLPFRSAFFPVFKHLIAYFIGFFPHYCHI